MVFDYFSKIKELDPIIPSFFALVIKALNVMQYLIPISTCLYFDRFGKDYFINASSKL